MSESNNISEILKNKNFTFSEEELDKIIEAELKKAKKDQNTEIIELCQNLKNTRNNTQEKNETKKKKLSFRLISLIITIAVLLFALIPVFLKFITPQHSNTFPQTEISSIADITVTTSVTATEPTTAPVSDTTRISTTCVAEVLTKGLAEPEQILFYHNGKPQTIHKGDVMCDEVIKAINKATKKDNWGILKLAVEEDYINRIKNENLCIEIFYNETQLLNGLNGHTFDEYNFEKILIVLDGDDKNTMFLSKDGKYQNGPIRPYNSALSEDILSYIFD